MADFIKFYLQGGVFMHVVTLCGLVGAAWLVGALRDGEGRARRLEGVTTMVHGCILFGFLGAALGFTEMFGALASLKDHEILQWHLAMSRGGQIALNPLTWGLMLAIPLVMAGGLLRLRPTDR